MVSLSRTQVRECDSRAIAAFGIPALVLMENAGRGAADVLVRLGIHGPVAVCCGKGNNGGDGLVLARHLFNLGIHVHVHLFANPAELSAETATHWNIVERLGTTATVWDLAVLDDAKLAVELAKAEWIVDALFGTGLTGPVRPPFDRIIQMINASATRVFALDIPSGLDADSGRPIGVTVRAQHTATFVAPKRGFLAPGAEEWLGRVHVVDIGVTFKD
ncbi:MAG: NAD(P)H-hydrate epimerase [Gemmataceae bacterium]|nr:NAD(P)H-hydrate epimerase [Gemmataceae bacterium]